MSNHKPMVSGCSGGKKIPVISKKDTKPSTQAKPK